MSSDVFAFKQFKIKQDKCAMKVGTDAVLLGAWTECGNAKKILDVGTGTGVLALMLAQKSEATIWAIDIDKDSFIDAKENVYQSKWNDRLKVLNISMQEFTKENSNDFDVIISNPPYFTDAYKAKELSRNTARHTDELPFDQLIECVVKLLSEDGHFFSILPYNEAIQFKNMAAKNNLYLIKSTRVKTKPEKEPKRLLMMYSRKQQIQIEDELVIELDERHHYTQQYINLTKDYYLDIDKK
jgi:tRNA1Val (adenine37-N6)-methyltransferase